jgi:hypothetical protein
VRHEAPLTTEPLSYSVEVAAGGVALARPRFEVVPARGSSHTTALVAVVSALAVALLVSVTYHRRAQGQLSRVHKEKLHAVEEQFKAQLAKFDLEEQANRDKERQIIKLAVEAVRQDAEDEVQRQLLDQWVRFRCFCTSPRRAARLPPS